MKLEKGLISSSQLMLLVAGFVQGSSLLIAFISGITKHDSWLAVLSGMMVSVPFILIYIALVQRFPGKNLVQINDVIYGPYLGKLFSIIHISFFFALISQNLRVIGDFVLTYIMPETPVVAILIMFTFICAWAVRSGIEVIARCSFILVAITTVIVLSTFLLLLQEMKLTNFLPVFDIPLGSFIQATHIMASIPFGEVLAFIMIIPYVNKIKQAKSSVLVGFFIGAGTLLIVTVRDIAVLGITASIMVSPPFEAVRLISIAKVLTRLEILVAIVLLVTFFLKVSVFYYGTVLGIAQLFNLRSYVPLVLPIGIISITMAVLAADSNLEQFYSAANTWPTFTIPFLFLIPPFSLLVAKIRGLPNKQRGAGK